MYAIISIFMTSSIGAYIFYKNIGKDGKATLIWYLILTAITNIISNTVFKIVYSYNEGLESKINYDISFFTKYSLLNMVLAIIISAVFVLISKSLKVSLVNEKVSKKSKK